ncbi:MAG: DUF1957 domain-containing protein, partial [Candidatus Omnitrophica bacterium]|nr:DUF1957 domain-containing protein [Candidatus Omnitrophota bacterium]
FFGKAPKGLWLPECGYRPGYPWTPPIGPEHGKYHANRPGLEVLAGEQGFEYFVLDSHSLRAGRSPQTYEQIFPALQNLRTKDRDAEMLPSAVRTPYQSYRIEGVPSTERGMSILVRDPICSGQVWGTTDAYPGDAYYCDFHKRHHPGGMRYWRVTDIRSDMVEKSVYEPHRAQECVQKHARDFANRVCSVLKISELGERAVVVAPFDTELFGHWWYEGPDWLGAALRELQKSGVSLKTCGDYLKSYPPDTAVVPAEGSWGAWGDHRVWLNRHTAWTWERLYDAEVQMERIMACVPEENSPELNRLLTQAMRELLLLQSSDWQFLITTESARDYSDRRFAEHYADYKRLMELSIKVMEGYATNEADREFLSYTEKVDCVFPDLDLSWYGDRSGEINAKPVGAGDDHGRRKGRAALPADS